MNRDIYIGRKKKMNNGYLATIVDILDEDTIDVQFEDGYVKRKVSINTFEKGTISKIPRYMLQQQIEKNKQNQKEKIGEEKMMSCGLKAKIIKYRKYKDIDVEFEDGTIVKHKDYGKFLKGHIKYPQEKNNLFATKLNEQFNKVNNTNTSAKQSKIGETRTMNCGLKATIIDYRKYDDMDVQFEDGLIVTNRRYNNFVNGKVRHAPNKDIKKNDKISEKTKLKEAQNKINNDINMDFEQVKKQLEELKEEVIQRLGEINTMLCGLEAIIIEYKNSDDISIYFEDGYIVNHTDYLSFVKGHIKHPVHGFNQVLRVGITKTLNCGVQATIINVLNKNKIDIQFDDGFIRKDINVADFNSGTVVYIRENIPENKTLFNKLRK